MWILFLILFCSIAQADQRVYYDPSTGKEIVDVSGVKSRNKIIMEFGVSNNVQEINISKNESYRIKNGNLEKFDFVQANQSKAEEKKQALKAKENMIKAKLNLSEMEMETLKEVLGR